MLKCFVGSGAEWPVFSGIKSFITKSAVLAGTWTVGIVLLPAPSGCIRKRRLCASYIASGFFVPHPSLKLHNNQAQSSSWLEKTIYRNTQSFTGKFLTLSCKALNAGRTDTVNTVTYLPILNLCNLAY